MSRGPIKAALHIINSRRDIYGNCYWAATYTDTATGRGCSFTVAARSNCEVAMYRGGMEHQHGEVLTTYEELPIRQYNRTVKGWPYAGCVEADIAAHIRAALDKES